MALNAGDQLSKDEREQLYTLFIEYNDLFAKSSEDFGCTRRIKHSIDTGRNHPIRQQTRRPRVDETLDTLSGSKWFSILDLINIGKWKWIPQTERRLLFALMRDYLNFRLCHLGYVMPLPPSKD